MPIEIIIIDDMVLSENSKPMTKELGEELREWIRKNNFIERYFNAD